MIDNYQASYVTKPTVNNPNETAMIYSVERNKSREFAAKVIVAGAVVAASYVVGSGIGKSW